MTKTNTASVATVTVAQVKAWWPESRANQIVAMMKAGLEYRRAVKRSRRYFHEGKYS